MTHEAATPCTPMEIELAIVDIRDEKIEEGLPFTYWPRNLSLFMLAQILLEQARGTALKGFNVGNIIWTQGCGLPFYEVGNLPPPDPPTVKFRRYASLKEGTKAYVNLLFGKYYDAKHYASIGRWEEAVSSLHDSGYFGADPVKYAHAMVYLVKELDSFGYFNTGVRYAMDHVQGRIWRLAEDIDSGTALTGMDVVDKLGEQ